MTIVAGLASAAVLLASGAGYATAQHYGGQINHLDAFAGLSDRPADDGATNILVVGSDDRSGLTDDQKAELSVGFDDVGRNTDSMMLVHLGSDGSVGVVSIPRDSYVEIPGYSDADGVRHDATKQKINAAYAMGGAPLMVATVEHATGVRIDHYAELNFAGFVDIVSALGGVDVCAPTALKDTNSGLDIPPGRQTLDGRAGLAYVRARYFDPTSDIGRMKRQQAFLGSLFSKAVSPGVVLDPGKFNRFLESVLSSITTDPGLDTGALMALAQRARATSPSSVTFQTVPITGGENVDGVGAVVAWDKPKADWLFSQLRTEGALGDQPAAPAAPVVERAPADIEVQVYNGSGEVGSGSTAVADLTAAGYNVQGTAQPADGDVVAGTVIEYDPSYDISLRTLQASLPGATTKAMPGIGGVFRVVVGSTYAGVTPVTVAPPTVPASESPDPDVAPTLGPRPHTAADNICE